MAGSDALAVLVLCNRPARGAEASAVSDHLDAFARHSSHRITILSFLGDLPAGLALDRFDCIVLHWTVAIGFLREHFLTAKARARIGAFGGLKVAFLQDEHRNVGYLIDSLRTMGIHLAYSCMPAAELRKVYPEEATAGIRFEQTLTGFVPQHLLDRARRPIAERPIDVGYRARRSPLWFGRLAWEKYAIAERFGRAADGSGLALDLSGEEGDRLYGAAWIDFVASCKAVLGTESGASVFDLDGTLQPQVEAFLNTRPDASFEEVHDRFLVPLEGRIKVNQISPRAFEAAALGTAMVLYEGEYSGILVPERHYLPLKKDFSNVAAVLAALRDQAALQAMADRAYREVACDPANHYSGMITAFDRTIAAEHAARNVARARLRAGRFAHAGDLARSPGYLVRHGLARLLQRLVLGTPIRRVLYRVWYRMPPGLRYSVRPLLRIIGR